MNKPIRSIVLVQLLLFLCLSASSQKFLTYTLEDGLSQVSVNDVIEDKDGYLWIGTQSGLNRYDGRLFKVYRHSSHDSNSVSGDFINCLKEDSLGNIWVGTENNGLSFYNKNTYRFEHVLKYLDNLTVNELALDKTGAVWAALGKDGIASFEFDNTGFINNMRLELASEITSIYASDNVYCGTGNGAVYQLDVEDGQLIYKQILKLVGEERIYSITWLSDEMLIIGTSQQAYIYSKNSTGEFQQIHEVFNSPHVIYDFEMVSNSIWMATGDGLYNANLSDFNYNKFELQNHYTIDDLNSESLSNNTVFCLHKGTDSSLWIGTGKFLNLLYRNTVFETIKATPGTVSAINSNVVFSIYKDSHFLWVGTSGGGLNRLGKKQTDYFHTTNSSLTSNVIFDITEDLDKNLWIGTKNGVFIIPKESRSSRKPEMLNLKDLLPTTQQLEDYFVRDIYADAIGNIWVCTYNGGLARITGSIKRQTLSCQIFQHIDGVSNQISSNRVYCLVEDNKNGYWIGTDKGLNRLRYDNKAWTFRVWTNETTDPYSISNNVVYDLLNHKNGSIWIATRNGLNCLRDEQMSFTKFEMNDGLPDKTIYALEEDGNGDIWCSTNKGLVKFNSPDSSFINYTIDDGLQSNEFNLHASYFNPQNGELYFGGINGLNIFHPDNLNNIDKKTIITISDIEYGAINEEVTLQEFELELARNEGLILNHDQFPIHLQLSNIDLRPYKSTELIYRLLPLDLKWNVLSKDRTLQLMKLMPGSYTLQIQGSSRKKQWDEEPLELKITVQPPLWRSTMAYTIYSLLFFLAVYLVYRLQLKQTLARQETKRLRELDKLKNQLYSEITHEFRTPLTVIQGVANKIKTKQLAKELEQIDRNSSYLLNLVNQMLDLSKIDQLQLSVNYVQSDIIPYVKYVFNCFTSWAEQKNIKYTLYLEKDAITMDYDPNHLYKVITNLISNAIKYTPEEGDVIVHVSVNEDQSRFYLKVSDSGIGVPKEDRERIFESFYRSKNTTGHSGVGIGLALTKRLTVLMGGDISVESLTTGTVFSVSLPLQNKAEVSSSEIYPEFIVPSKEPQRVKCNVEENSDKSIVLVIEDHADVADFIASCLQDRYQVIVESNGELGIERAFEVIPDIVITDVMMPLKDGYEVCTALKKDLKTNHIPIVMLTAKAGDEMKNLGYSIGADAYIIKPFQPTELLLRIFRLLETRNAIISTYANSGTSVQQIAGVSEDAFVTKAIEYIMNEIDNSEYKASDLAFKFHLSESQLYRKIKASTGFSTALFIRQVRLDKSKELLVSSQQTISEICYSCGFSNPAWFSKVFKEKFDQSPSDFRAQTGN